MLRITPLLILCLPLAASAQMLTPTVIARNGQSVLDVAGATFASIGLLPRLGANGHVAFNGFITGGGVVGANDFGYWVGTAPETLVAAIREDTSNGGPGQFPTDANVGVDADGGVSSWTELAFPVPANQNQYLYTYLPGSDVVAQEGGTAPGFAGGLFSDIKKTHASNDTGALAFYAIVTGGDVSGTSNDLGLFTGTPANLTLVTREGSAAPDATGTSPVFSELFDKRINTSGQVSFATRLVGDGVTVGTNDLATYVWSPNGGNGTLAKATQTGDNAPGTSPTISFKTLDDQPGFSDAGQVAFRASLISSVPGELNLVNDSGIWAGAPGNVQLVMRSDTPSPIAGLNFRAPEATTSPRINASGQVVFISLVSGSGVTLANDRVLWLTTPTGTQVVARESDPAVGTPAGVNYGTLDGVAAINDAGQVVFGSTLVGTGVSGLNDRGLWGGTPRNVSLIAREGDMVDLDPSEGELLRTIQSISFATGFSSPVGSSASAALNDAGQVAWQAQFTAASGGGTAVFLTTLPSPPVPSLDGDYNDDGVVDTADFVVWQKFNTTSTDLPNDPNPLPIDNDQYTTWQIHFGESDAGAGGADFLSDAAVPEPCNFWLLGIAAGFGFAGSNVRRKR